VVAGDHPRLAHYATKEEITATGMWKNNQRDRHLLVCAFLLPAALLSGKSHPEPLGDRETLPLCSRHGVSEDAAAFACKARHLCAAAISASQHSADSIFQQVSKKGPARKPLPHRHGGPEALASLRLM